MTRRSFEPVYVPPPVRAGVPWRDAFAGLGLVVVMAAACLLLFL